MKAKNLIGVNNRRSVDRRVWPEPVIEQKNEYICMKIKDISYTLFGILPPLTKSQKMITEPAWILSPELLQKLPEILFDGKLFPPWR